MPRLLIVCTLLGAALQAQVRSPAESTQPIVVSGCLHGRTLEATQASTFGVSSDSFRLHGPKQLMKALREYEGYELEITGKLRDTEGRLGATRTRQLGRRTRITVGVREERNTQQPGDPELTVESFRPLRPRCER